MKLSASILCVPTESSPQTRKIQMQENKFYRSLLVIATTAALWSAPALLRAAELQPLIVTGVALDKVATVHPAPVYPRAALALGIDGIVEIEVTVQNGRIIEANVLSGSPLLASSAKEWIVWNWKFRPEINGVITIPINYQRHA
jgi:outer membrane biosynthesis protein TonB